MKRNYYPFVVFVLAAIFILTFSSFVSAEEPINDIEKSEVIYNPFYIGVFGGGIMPEDLKVEDGAGTTQYFKLGNSAVGGAKIGYIFPFRWLAAELEYSYLGNHDFKSPNPTDQHFRAQNAMFNLLLRYPGRLIRPYIGGGAGWSWGKYLDSGNDESVNAFGWQAMAGVNMEIIPSLSFDVGYRFFTSKYDLNDVDTTIKDHMLLVGLNYHFGGVKPVPPPPPPEPAPEPIPVKVNKCPDTPLCCIVDGEGCPIDTDKDGVCDGCDKCPDTPSDCAVDENGCPLDSDKDGVIDCRDKCPGTPSGCAVDENGCPLDSDKDGVIDCRDKCPGTPVGVKVDKDGCPIPEILEKGRTTLKVLFDFDKDTIKGNYSKDIVTLADVMKKYENLNVTIEGHTDNIGTAAYNKKLSQRRADAVKKYLVEKSGIGAKRLTAKGFGLEKPIASNKTKEGRQKNRRVEAAVDYIIKK